MYTVEIVPSLQKELQILSLKDAVLYEASCKKMLQVGLIGPHHYKNLRSDMKQYKRVHVRGSFVLLFRVDEESKRIIFECLEHHDDVYRT